MFRGQQMSSGRFLTQGQKTRNLIEVGGRRVEKIKQNPFVKKVGFNRIVLCFVLLLMYAFFCALTQGSFFGIERILSTQLCIFLDSYHWELPL